MKLEKLRKEKLHNLNSLPDIIRMIKSRMMIWARNVARMGDMRNAYTILVGTLEEYKPHGRPRNRWKDNITINIVECSKDVEWIQLAQDRDQWRALLNPIMNLRVPLKKREFLYN
jgi:hypothetical protein